MKKLVLKIDFFILFNYIISNHIRNKLDQIVKKSTSNNRSNINEDGSLRHPKNESEILYTIF